MDEAAERMAAVKRAYAEIILNVTKESAARVLAADVKAMRLRKELAAAKEEALRTVLRVKVIMDAKVSETQKASSAQARRIRDLEELLEESHKTITSLQAELKKLRGDIDVETSSVETPNSESVLKNFDNHEERKELCPLSGSTLRHDNLDAVEMLSNKPTSIVHSHSEVAVNSLQPKPTDINTPEDKHFCGPDSNSLRNLEESELPRPGFKQIIPALEQNVVTREASNRHENRLLISSCCKLRTSQTPQIRNSNLDQKSGNVDALKISCVGTDVASSRKIVKGIKRRKRVISKLSAQSRQIMDSNINTITSHLGKRRRKRRINMDTRTKRKNLSDLLSHKNVPCNSSRNSKNSDQCPQDAHFSVSSVPKGDLDRGQRRPSDTEVNLMDTDIADDEAVVKASESLSFLRRCFQNSEAYISACKEEAPAVAVDCNAAEPLAGINLDKAVSLGNPNPVCGFETGGSLNQFTSNGIPTYAYTFKRKRLRGTSNLVQKTDVSEESNERWDKDCGLQETQRTTSLRVSSCDDRRIAQVARQLVSLSQKRWG